MSTRISIWPREETIALNSAFKLVPIKDVYEISRFFKGDNRPTSIGDLEEELYLHDTVLLRYSPESEKYYILTTNMHFTCILDEHHNDYMMILGITDARNRIRRNFIKGSLKIEAKGGFKLYQNQGSRSDSFTSDFPGFIENVRRKWIELKLDSADTDDEPGEEVNASYELRQVMENVKAYINFEYEHERSRVQGSGQMLYRRIEPVSHQRYSKSFYKFIMDEPSKLKVNDLVQITGSSREEINGEVTEIYPDGAIIAFSQQLNFRDIPAAGTLSLALNDIQREIRLKTVDSILSGNVPAKYLDSVLGKKEYLPLTNSTMNLDPKFNGNPAQKDAILKGVRSQDLLMVLGPPGTGKTTVILQWVAEFIRQKKRVLISSKSNKAVDNVLERFVGSQKLQVIRIGNEDRVSGKMQEALLDVRAVKLQEQIAEKSRASINRLEGTLTKLQSILGKFQEIFEVEEEAGKYIRIIGEKQTEIINKYDPYLRKYMSSFEEATGKLKKIYWVLRILIKVLGWAERSRMKNRFLGALAFGPDWFSGKLYKFYGEKAAILKIQEQEAVDSYNEIREKLERECQGEEILKAKRKRNSYEKIFENVKESLKTLRWTENEMKSYRPSKVEEYNFGDSRMLVSEVSELLTKARRAWHIAGEWKETVESKRQKVLYDILIKTVDVVGATCIGINSDKRFADTDFDIAIIDEAGQIQIHDVLVPLSRAPRAIMLGDHLQLPPIVEDGVKKMCSDENVDMELLEKSLFEYLYSGANRNNKAFLNKQFRMPSEIAELISGKFYDNEYESGDVKKNMKSILPFFKTPFSCVTTSQSRGNHELSKDDSYINDFEAKLIVNMTSKILDLGFSMKDIGIITPYKKQAELIQRYLMEVPKINTADVNLNDCVASVDSFQGQERTIIIFSFTRSNTRGKIGFLSDLRRLNVTLTRPLNQLIVVGDMKMLSNSNNPEFSSFISSMLQKLREKGEIITTGELEMRWGEMNGI